MINSFPKPTNEWQRLLFFADFNMELSSLDESLSGLTRLAAQITGKPITMVNLISNHLQTSVSRYGIEVSTIPREESVCQYTILNNHPLEITELSKDHRFADISFVKEGPKLNYYYGVPLTTTTGLNIGALCVLDQQPGKLDIEKASMLAAIAKEVVEKIIARKEMEALRLKMDAITATQAKLAHDIRGPIGGIVGVARLFKKQSGETGPGNKISQAFDMIEQSGVSLLSLAEEILNSTGATVTAATKANGQAASLFQIKDRIEKLYLPMAQGKNQQLVVSAETDDVAIDFINSNLMQICGNLVSNAIKFTPAGGKIHTQFSITTINRSKTLHIRVSDNGKGLHDHEIKNIILGNVVSTPGTIGETGHGLGLAMVKHLVDKAGGAIQVFSKPQEGTTFEIRLPQHTLATGGALPAYSPVSAKSVLN